MKIWGICPGSAEEWSNCTTGRWGCVTSQFCLGRVKKTCQIHPQLISMYGGVAGFSCLSLSQLWANRRHCRAGNPTNQDGRDLSYFPPFFTYSRFCYRNIHFLKKRLKTKRLLTLSDRATKDAPIELKISG
jgi:hypothetical protein